MIRRAFQSGRERKDKVTGEWSGNIIYQTRRACVMITNDQGEVGARHNAEPSIKPIKEEIHNTDILEPEENKEREKKREKGSRRKR